MWTHCWRAEGLQTGKGGVPAPAFGSQAVVRRITADACSILKSSSAIAKDLQKRSWSLDDLRAFGVLDLSIGRIVSHVDPPYAIGTQAMKSRTRKFPPRHPLVRQSHNPLVAFGALVSVTSALFDTTPLFSLSLRAARHGNFNVRIRTNIRRDPLCLPLMCSWRIAVGREQTVCEASS